MCKRFSLSLTIISCWVFSSICQAAVIENVRSFRDSDHTRLVFDLSESVEHRVFTLDNPYRIVLDISDSDLNKDLSTLNINNSPINNIRSATRNDKDLRIVFDLKSEVQPKSFSLTPDSDNGDRLVLDFYDNIATSINTNTQATASVAEIANGRRDIVVAIAAGHGGDKPGAVGIDNIQEKTVVLAIAREVEKALEQMPGFKPVMIRDGDYHVGLKQRIEKAHDERADLFIAIHADAFTNNKAKGATIYALSLRGATSEHARRLAAKENSADLIGGVGSVSLNDKDKVLSSVLLDLSMTATIATSLEVGDKIISSLGNVTRMRRTNVEQANFVVLRSVDIPSLLIEAGYITNPTDARNLNSPRHRQKFAGALVNGITNYFYEAPPRGTWVSWQKENGIGPGSYIVSRGDNLSEIAQRHNVSLNALKQANNISGSRISIGQELIIPNAFLTASTQISFMEHIVARGETLSGIAEDYSISLQRIRETNQLNSDIIRIGQTLRIPSA